MVDIPPKALAGEASIGANADGDEGGTRREPNEILSSQVSRSGELTPLQLFTGTGACTSEAEKEPEKLIPWTQCRLHPASTT